MSTDAELTAGVAVHLERTLVVSTAHVTMADSLALPSLVERDGLAMTVVCYPYGWIISVPCCESMSGCQTRLREAGLSEALPRLLELALRVGATLLRLDADGYELPEELAPTHEWVSA